METNFFSDGYFGGEHHKHMKLIKPFIPHVTELSVRKGFKQLICRSKEQKTRLQGLVNVMPKSVIPSAQKLKIACF